MAAHSSRIDGRDFDGENTGVGHLDVEPRQMEAQRVYYEYANIRCFAWIALAVGEVASAPPGRFAPPRTSGWFSCPFTARN